MDNVIGSDNDSNHLTGEIDHKIPQALTGLMNSFNLQFKKTTNGAINQRVLPQIQAFLRTLKEQRT